MINLEEIVKKYGNNLISTYKSKSGEYAAFDLYKELENKIEKDGNY